MNAIETLAQRIRDYFTKRSDISNIHTRDMAPDPPADDPDAAEREALKANIKLLEAKIAALKRDPSVQRTQERQRAAEKLKIEILK